MDVARQRLHNQHLSSPAFKKPADVVKWLGAVQAQDYYGAKWALGQRMVGATDDAIEKAFADGKILRTHVMRPTWHFVAPADIRWMLKLTSPRVNASNGLIGGRVVGRWKRSFKRNSVIISLSPFAPFSKAERQAVDDAAHRYGSFLGMKVLLA